MEDRGLSRGRAPEPRAFLAAPKRCDTGRGDRVVLCAGVNLGTIPVMHLAFSAQDFHDSARGRERSRWEHAL